MPVSVDRKKQLIAQYGKDENDPGAAGAQIAILTERINNLTLHLQAHKKDFGSRRGLLKLIGQRRRLQTYLQRQNPEEYANLIKGLELRR